MSKKHDYVIVDTRIIQDPRLSLEAIGYYVMFEGDAIESKDIPSHITQELIKIGYIFEKKIGN